MHQPKYCLFYDNHTMPACLDVGDKFDAELFTYRIKECGVDYLTFHARSNMGMAYYDTKIGIKHPSLKYDLFGKLVEACQRKDIALAAYLNGGISNEEGLQQHEWTILLFDGLEYREQRLTPYIRTMCYNSFCRDQLIAMVEEIAHNYPVAGFFIDCLAAYSCVLPTCFKAINKSNIDWNVESKIVKFSEFSELGLSYDIAQAAKAINPEYLLYLNGPSFEGQADVGTYLECECLPTGCRDYEFLPTFSHYMHALRNKPILNMTGRFYNWGDFGGLRPESAIKSELLYGLANGNRRSVDTFRTGKISQSGY